jgi:hypothetical protein
MNMKEVREMAKRVGARIGNMKKLDAIRSIQVAEGYADCFGRVPTSQCNQFDCCFREDCLAYETAYGK